MVHPSLDGVLQLPLHDWNCIASTSHSVVSPKVTSHTHIHNLLFTLYIELLYSYRIKTKQKNKQKNKTKKNKKTTCSTEVKAQSTTVHRKRKIKTAKTVNLQLQALKPSTCPLTCMALITLIYHHLFPLGIKPLE